MKKLIWMGFVLVQLVPWVHVAHADAFTAKVYELGSQRKTLLFNLERKEFLSGTGLRATGTFVDAAGKLAISEEAISENGKLRKYTLEQHQLGEKGVLEIRDGKAHFTYSRAGKTKTDEEDAVDNLIIGPTTMEFLKANWQKILAGEDVVARFAVLDRLETVGFKYFKIGESEVNGKKVVQVKMKPTSFIIAGIVDPLIFTIERDTVKLVELKGRTLPKKKVGDKWKDVDGEIVYSY